MRAQDIVLDQVIRAVQVEKYPVAVVAPVPVDPDVDVAFPDLVLQRIDHPHGPPLDVLDFDILHPGVLGASPSRS